tara:strand:- start:1884 stop:2924 length:1041 start_codon:yes stop_codon:yes gene_type:complete
MDIFTLNNIIKKAYKNKVNDIIAQAQLAVTSQKEILIATKAAYDEQVKLVDDINLTFNFSEDEYCINDFFHNQESIIDVDKEIIKNILPSDYIDYTSELYDRMDIVITTEEKERGIVPGSERHNYNTTDRVYMHCGVQLLPYRDIIANHSVLDIGCGMGDFSFFCEYLGASNITGIDVHQENIDICNKIKQYYNLKTIFSIMDMNKLDINYLENFDTVIIFGVLPWTNCHIELFKKIKEANVKHLILAQMVYGLPIYDCLIRDKTYNIKEPMIELVWRTNYHYGSYSNTDKTLCYKPNLSFFIEALKYTGWYIENWTWMKNCTLNQKNPNISKFNQRFVFNCINSI